MTQPHLIFFGSDQYSAIVLDILLESKIYHLESVVTDHHHDPTPVEKLAVKHKLKVSYYPSNSDEMNNFIDLLKSNISNLESDQSPIGLCASFDHLIPAEIIEKFHGNLYNLHPSLLPQYRNVSPVQYAIALGDKETGISLFRITTGIDNGEIIAQVSEPIHADDTTPTLTSRLFAKGAKLLQGSVLCNPSVSTPDNKGRILVEPTLPLIFTRRLTRESGFVEWPTLHKLLTNQPIEPSSTTNELLRLRLNKDKTHNFKIVNCKLIIGDLLRSLTPWPSVWSLVPTKKGDLRLRLVEASAKTGSSSILIAGKPSPISLSDFTKYYL